jgi:hypothetical protein
MEQPNRIDELLSQRLHDSAVQPPDFVWPKVEQQLRRRRRRIFFWLFFGTGMLGGAWLAHRGGTEPQLAATAPEAEQVAVADAPKMAAPATHDAPVDAQGPSVGRATAAPASKPVRGPRGNAAAPLATALPAALLPVSLPGEGMLSPEASGPSGQLRPAPGADVMAHSDQMAFLPQKSGLVQQMEALALRPRGPLPKPKPIIRKKQEPRHCYDFAAHPNVFLLDAYAGLSLARKSLSSGPDFQPYLKDRLRTERRDWAFSAGIRGSLLLDRHFLLRSGLHYDQVTEVFEFIDPNSIEVTIRQTTQIINGEPVLRIDTLSIHFGEQYQKTYNRLGFLDIPLMAGVELRRGRSGINVNGGVALNLLFWKRGSILSPAGTPQDFSPGAQEIFRANAGLSALASVQWFYHLRPKVRVFAEPYFRSVLRPLNLPEHPIEQRQAMMGLQVGITRIFD